MDLQQICQQVCEAALTAGNYIADQRKVFTTEAVEFKGTQNLVSYVDKEAEKLLVSALGGILPEAGFITEEGMVAQSVHKRYKWVIDPLDGTTNFIHGLPPYCVSIALLDDDEPIVGVVYEVTMREMFYAWQDSEAYLNGKPIHVSSVKSLQDSLITIGFSYATLSEVDDFLDSISYFQQNTNGVRRLGSAAADLVYVACGRMDGYYQVKLAPWDVAAGALIARQAGAVVTDYSGGRDYIFGQEIIASNPHIYEAFKLNIR